MKKDQKTKISPEYLSAMLKVFAEIQRAHTLSNRQLFELVKLARENPIMFSIGFEQCYLRIFQRLLSGKHPKIVTRFQEVTEFLTKQLMTQGDQDSTNQERTAKIQKCYVSGALDIFTEAIYSTCTQIRIMAARLVFMVIKAVDPSTFLKLCDIKVAEETSRAVIFLLRQTTNSYKQIGVKLASVLTEMADLPGREEISSELIRIMIAQDNEETRKMTVVNFRLYPEVMDDILVRLRDKAPEIRRLVIKKLIKDHVELHELGQSALYKLLYDGFGSKSQDLSQQTLNFFLGFFTNPSRNGVIEAENKFSCFIELFVPEMLLKQPILYALFIRLVTEITGELAIKVIEPYLRDLCRRVKAVASGRWEALGRELIWLRAAASNKTKDIGILYEEMSPSESQFSVLLTELAQRKQFFGLYELLQLIGKQQAPEEIGRQRMFEALKGILRNLNDEHIELPPLGGEVNSEICPKLTDEEVEQRKLLLNYFDLPLITKSTDFSFPIILAMKNLNPEHFEMELKELIQDWNTGQLASLEKDKYIININLAKTRETQGHLISTLQENLQAIEKKIESKMVTITAVIVALCRVSSGFLLDDYILLMSKLLKQEQTKATGMLLLGFHCWNQESNLKDFFALIWKAMASEESSDQVKQVSVKVMTDLLVKNNLLKNKEFTYNGYESVPFSSDSFFNAFTKILFSSNLQNRLQAVECGCRLLYHERIEELETPKYFVMILMLWWETNEKDECGRIVHMISHFVKRILSHSNKAVSRFSEMLSIYFRVLSHMHSAGLTINREVVRYNLRTQYFLQAALGAASTVLRYKKESTEVIYSYRKEDIRLGPQQTFLLTVLRDDVLNDFLDQSLFPCDFYDDCSLQVLILVKKSLEVLCETKSQKRRNQTIIRFDDELKSRIDSKNADVFNEQILKGLQEEFEEYRKHINDVAKDIYTFCSSNGIFIKSHRRRDGKKEEDEESGSAEDEQQQEIDVVQTTSMRKKAPQPIQQVIVGPKTRRRRN